MGVITEDDRMDTINRLQTVEDGVQVAANQAEGRDAPSGEAPENERHARSWSAFRPAGLSRAIGQLLQALGIVSLLQGSLDVRFGLEKILEYYVSLRNLLLVPAQLVGFSVPTRYADLWIIASVFYAAVSKDGREDDAQTARNFFGSLILVWPFLIASQRAAAIAIWEVHALLPLGVHGSPFWQIIALLIMLTVGVLFLWISAFCLLGGLATFYWIAVLAFPPIHWLLIRFWVYLRHQKVLPWFTLLATSVIGPGVLLSRLLVIFRGGEVLSITELARRQSQYWVNPSMQRLKDYYWLLGRYLFGSLLILLVVKLLVDSLATFANG